MVGFLIILILFTVGLYFVLSISDVKEIKENWPKYRCRASIMPFSSVYGFDTQENFNYCMSNIMSKEAGPLLSPVFEILGVILSTIAIIINTINSFRVQIATMMGGINTIFQNFTDRISQLTGKLKLSAARIKSLMLRLYGIFFAIIYMSLSGVRALNNFSNTFLFKFLDTFCFDPTTPVDIEGKGIIPIRDVKIGDRFNQNNARVTGVFSFAADGQPMVKLGSVTVSTNHFVQHNGKLIRADEHPDAIDTLPWLGGAKSPLICLNTDTHTIPIGSYVFKDYDETEEGDNETKVMIQNQLNASTSDTTKPYSYSNVVSPTTLVLTKEGAKWISAVELNDRLQNGSVIGIVQKEVEEVCTLPDGTQVGAGLLLWHQTKWVRAGDLHPVETLSTPVVFWNVFLTPSAVVESVDGLFFRDYMELHSHDAEFHYEKYLRSTA
jgi:hypothetical protein